MDKLNRGDNIKPASGKLGVMIVGLGAVSTTFLAGVLAVRKGVGRPIGSLTQMGKLRLGKRTEERIVSIQDFVPLAGLDDLVFCCWDIFEDSAALAAHKSQVLKKEHIDAIASELEAITPLRLQHKQNT